MDDDLSAWEAKLGPLAPELRKTLLEWLQEERESWAAREEQWQRVQELMSLSRIQSPGH
jgi:hypothetical protein